jgi:hypothetical protein
LLLDKKVTVENAVGRGAVSDNLKEAAGGIYNAAKKRLQLRCCGNDTKAFMLATPAPLIEPGMMVYQELKKDMFD